jgi:hypothetical protein
MRGPPQPPAPKRPCAVPKGEHEAAAAGGGWQRGSGGCRRLARAGKGEEGGRNPAAPRFDASSLSLVPRRRGHAGAQIRAEMG